MLSDTGCVAALVHLEEVMPHGRLTSTLDAVLEQIQQYATYFTFKKLADGERFMCDLETRADNRRTEKQSKPEKKSLSTSTTNPSIPSSSSAPNPTPAIHKCLVKLPSESPSSTPSSVATHGPTKSHSNESSSAKQPRSIIPPPGHSHSIPKGPPSSLTKKYPSLS